jgi:hypothetical protein
LVGRWVILGLDLDVDLFGLGEDGDGDGRGVDAALGLGRGDTLHAVDAGLVLEQGVDAVAFDDGGDVLEAVADAGLGLREDLDLPAVLLGETEVHAEDLGDEEGGLVAAGAGAEFEDDVLLVVGILGQEQHLELLFDRGKARLEAGQLLLRHGAEVWVGLGEHGLGVGDGVADVAVLAELFDDGFEVAMLLGGGLELLLVVDEGGIGELLAEVFVAGFDLVETVKHGNS